MAAFLPILGGIASVGTVAWLVYVIYREVRHGDGAVMEGGSPTGARVNPRDVRALLASDLPRQANLDIFARKYAPQAQALGEKAAMIAAERAAAIPPQALASRKPKWMKKWYEFEHRIEAVEREQKALITQALRDVEEDALTRGDGHARMDARMDNVRDTLTRTFFAAVASRTKPAKRNPKQKGGRADALFRGGQAESRELRMGRSAMKTRTKGIGKAGETPARVGSMRPRDPQQGVYFAVVLPGDDPDGQGYVTVRVDTSGGGRTFTRFFGSNDAPTYQLRNITMKQFQERTEADREAEEAALDEMPAYQREAVIARLDRKYDVTWAGPGVALFRTANRYTLPEAVDALQDWIYYSERIVRKRLGPKDPDYVVQKRLGVAGLNESARNFLIGQWSQALPAILRAARGTVPQSAQQVKFLKGFTVNARAARAVQSKDGGPMFSVGSAQGKRPLLPGQVGRVEFEGAPLYAQYLGIVGRLPGWSEVDLRAMFGIAPEVEIKSEAIAAWMEGSKKLPLYVLSKDGIFPDMGLGMRGVQGPARPEVQQAERQAVVSEIGFLIYGTQFAPEALELAGINVDEVPDIIAARLANYTPAQQDKIRELVTRDVALRMEAVDLGKPLVAVTREAPEVRRAPRFILVPDHEDWNIGMLLQEGSKKAVYAFGDGQKRSVNYKNMERVQDVTATVDASPQREDFLDELFRVHGLVRRPVPRSNPRRANPWGLLARGAARGAVAGARWGAAYAPRVVASTSKWLKTPAGMAVTSSIVAVALEYGLAHGRLKSSDVKLIQAAVQEQTGTKPTGSTVRAALETAVDRGVLPSTIAR